jgi:hypothetical protein
MRGFIIHTAKRERFTVYLINLISPPNSSVSSLTAPESDSRERFVSFLVGGKTFFP